MAGLGLLLDWQIRKKLTDASSSKRALPLGYGVKFFFLDPEYALNVLGVIETPVGTLGR